MPAYISVNTDGLTDGNFTITTNNIITAMKGNKDFPLPPHPLEDIEIDFNAYKVLSKNRNDMSPKDTKDRNDLRGKIVKKMSENGKYVISLFPDDQNKQQSSGYDLVKSRNTSGAPDTPTRVKAAAGNMEGEVKLYWTGSSIAKSYNIRYRIKDSDDAWQYKPVPRSRGVVISDLKSGEMYEVWVQAIGAKRDSNYGGPGEARAY